MRVYSVILILFLLPACQHTKAKKEIQVEASDIVESFQKLPPETQKTALENGWVYFTYAFQFPAFQQRALKEFPGLAVFGSRAALVGKTPLDLRLLNNYETNPIALLLAIDLEMEILSRFHTNTQRSPRCLESFWTEMGLSLPKSQVSAYSPEMAREPTQSEMKNLETTREVPLNERSRRLSIYLKQSLGIASDTPVKLLQFEDPVRAQFLVGNESYEIFTSPIECKVLAEKKHLIPQLGKMKCLQKQSAAWITVSAKESTVVSDNWVSEVKQRCQKWVHPLVDQLRKENSLQIKDSPISRAWSLYPRLRNFVISEANRYESSFRQNL